MPKKSAPQNDPEPQVEEEAPVAVDDQPLFDEPVYHDEPAEPVQAPVTLPAGGTDRIPVARVETYGLGDLWGYEALDLHGNVLFRSDANYASADEARSNCPNEI